MHKNHSDVLKTLKEWIFSGKYRPGEKLPSEPALSSTLETTRKTLRVALDQLEQEQLIRRGKRTGTFVTDFRKEKDHLIFYSMFCTDIKSLLLPYRIRKIHMLILSGLTEQAAKYNAAVLPWQISKHNSAESLDLDALRYIPDGARVATSSCMPAEVCDLLIRKKCRLVWFAGAVPPYSSPSWRIYWERYELSVPVILDYFQEKGAKHPLFIISNGAVFNPDVIAVECRKRKMIFDPQKSVLKGIDDSRELRRITASVISRFDGVFFDMEFYTPDTDLNPKKDLKLPDGIPFLSRESNSSRLDMPLDFDYLEFPKREMAADAVNWLFSHEPGRIIEVREQVFNENKIDPKRKQTFV